jgi:succinate dehydrogenase/fumarate reductase flavoprotein subunit
MEDGAVRGVMALNMEDGTLHRFRAHKTVLATGLLDYINCRWLWTSLFQLH